ncbi:efflux RND transporter periplasmic adaptor subunit [Halalkalibaculum sp. DA384]|uniref:efflux RND transporter periplasmic adaptor subunit n=1 Tax=Halalkalibaculum sp. DA384 TaxID=3373606 RepID=UPI003753F0FD
MNNYPMIFAAGSYIRSTTVALVAVFFVVSCSDEASQGNSDSPTNSVIPAVEAVEARYGSLPLSERLSGTVIAENQVELYPEISGRVAEVLVSNGGEVQKGDPLVRLDDTQYREQVQQAEASYRISNARLKQARARLRQLEAEYKRTKTLADRDLSSELEMETLEAQMASAEADVELAEAELERAQSTLEEQKEMLQRTVIRAPITGSVGQRNAEVGMQVGTGTHLFTIGNLGDLRVEVVLTEDMLNRIEIGQTAEIMAPTRDGQTEIIQAELSRISPFLNPVARSTEAEIDVSNEKGLLRPGMFVAVDILYGESEQATLLPTSALYTDPQTGEEGVYVATTLGSEVEPVESTPDDSGNPAPLTEPVDVEFKVIDVIAEGRMELGVAGVEPGDWVITVGQHLLTGGRRQARVRTSSWERILTLQGYQRNDLLQEVLNTQQQSPQQPTM